VTGPAALRIKGNWQLQDAKANFSHVVNRALEDGPQRITRHGRPAAVLLSNRDFDELVARKRGSLVEFLERSPLKGVDIPERDHGDTGREIDL
jgi:prevent-host-death family protein